MKTTAINMATIPLPSKYDTMQEVDNVELNGFPVPPIHKPVLYLLRDTLANQFSVACASVHGNNQFYGNPGVVVTPQRWQISYTHAAATENAGVMVHVHRDKAPIAPEVVMLVDGTEGTPITAGSDDASEPMNVGTGFEDPLLLCNVLKDGAHPKVYCLVALTGTGKVLDIPALATRQFTKVLDHGNFVEWLLEIPLKTGTSTAALHYAAIPLVGVGGTMQTGDKVRVRLQTINPATGSGRSYAFLR